MGSAPVSHYQRKYTLRACRYQLLKHKLTREQNWRYKQSTWQTNGHDVSFLRSPVLDKEKLVKSAIPLVSHCHELCF